MKTWSKNGRGVRPVASGLKKRSSPGCLFEIFVSCQNRAPDMVATQCFPFPLRADWPVYLFWNVARSDTPSGKSGPKTPVTSVVNWPSNVCLLLCDTRSVRPRRSSQNWSAQFVGANGILSKMVRQTFLFFRCVKKSSVAVVKKGSPKWSVVYWRSQPPSKNRQNMVAVFCCRLRCVKNDRLFLLRFRSIKKWSSCFAVLKKWSPCLGVYLWSPCLSVSVRACWSL